MVVNGRISERLIDPNRGNELEEVIADGSYYGMQTFDQSLLDLYRHGAITRSVAVGAATHPHDLRLALDAVDAEREYGDTVQATAAG